jgi:hypothetical protein
MKNKNLKFKPAYKIVDWANKIVTGEAAPITFLDSFYEKDGYLFYSTEDSDKEPVLEFLHKNNVSFLLQDATNKLNKEKISYKEFLLKEIERYQKQLETL